MKPEYKLKHAILNIQAGWDGESLPKHLSEEEIQDLWDEADCLQDATSEIRSSGIEAGLEAQYSRHYECHAVAVQCPNGDWVGFNYWYGGGKHSDPGSIEWIPYAYDVEVKEEEKLVVVQTFSKNKKGEQ